MKTNVSYKERILNDCANKVITVDIAATRLRLSRRQIHRYIKRIRSKDKWIDRRNGLEPKNKTPALVIKRICDKHNEIVRICPVSYAQFYDEYMDSNIKVSLSTLQRILRKTGKISYLSREYKKKKIHPIRPRREKQGELLQLDACFDYWLNNWQKICCLISVDDATSKIGGIRFEKQETTIGYYHVLHQTLTNEGIPEVLYTDFRSVFVNNRYKFQNVSYDKLHSTQFGNATKRLGIKIISTMSPQAKGKVERKHWTLCNRLKTQLRTRGIKTIEEANEFAKEYIKYLNKKFAVNTNAPSAYRRKLTNEEANFVLSTLETRKICNGNIEIDGTIVTTTLNGVNRPLSDNQYCVVHKTLDGSILVEQYDHYYQTRIVASKTLPVSYTRKPSNVFVPDEDHFLRNVSIVLEI